MGVCKSNLYESCDTYEQCTRCFGTSKVALPGSSVVLDCCGAGKGNYCAACAVVFSSKARRCVTTKPDVPRAVG